MKLSTLWTGRRAKRKTRPDRLRHRKCPQLEALETYTLLSADLVVTSVTAPSAVIVPGDTFTVDWTVTNRGDTPATAQWYDTVYLSLTPSLGDGAIALANTWADGKQPLAAGSSYSLSQSVSVPRGTALGTYYLLVKADAANYQEEQDKTNNVGTSPAIALKAPDLVVISVTAPSGVIVPGETLTVTWTVANRGGVPATVPWYDAVYLSPIPSLGDGAILLTNTWAEGKQPLAVGDSCTLSADVAVPRGTALGTYYLLVKTDAANSQEEQDETNNVGTSPAIALKAPDLVVISVTAPSGVIVPGETLTVTWTVANRGGVPATVPWYDAVYLSPTPSLGDGAILLTNTWAEGKQPLAVGDSCTLSADVAVPRGTALGTYYLLVKTDAANSQEEQDETNNVGASPAVTLDAPDLAVTSVTAPAAVIPGDTFTVSWTATNVAGVPAATAWYDTVYLSPTPTLGDGAVVLTNAWAEGKQPLAVGDSYTLSATVAVPASTTFGRYFLVFRTDAANYQEKRDETNNTRAVPIVVNENGMAPGVAIIPTSGLSTTKSGGTATITVALSTRPTADVTIPLSSSNPSAGTVSPTSLVFTPANWSVPQTVTITGVNDHTTGDVDYQILLGAAISDDATYDGLEPGFVAVTNRDDIPSTPAPQVASVRVNDGTVQRSMVTSLTITFDGLVTLDPGAFVLRARGGGEVGVLPATTTVDGRTVVMLTFTGDGIVGGSLADGRYQLTIDAAKVKGEGGRPMAADSVTEFFRLFGDANGDGVVDNADYFIFRSTAGKKQVESGYLWYLDFDASGVVDLVTSYAAFQARNRKTLA